MCARRLSCVTSRRSWPSMVIRTGPETCFTPPTTATNVAAFVALDGDEVVGVGGVPQAQRQADQEYGPESRRSV